MSNWWQASASNYFCRVKKEQIVQAIEEATRAPVDERLKALKKKDLAAEAEKSVTGTPLDSRVASKLINRRPGSFVNSANPSKKMKVGDSVYLVTDQLKTGAGVPAMICETQDSTVKVAIEETNGTRVLQAKPGTCSPRASSLIRCSTLSTRPIWRSNVIADRFST